MGSIYVPTQQTSVLTCHMHGFSVYEEGPRAVTLWVLLRCIFYSVKRQEIESFDETS